MEPQPIATPLFDVPETESVREALALPYAVSRGSSYPYMVVALLVATGSLNLVPYLFQGEFSLQWITISIAGLLLVLAVIRDALGPARLALTNEGISIRRMGLLGGYSRTPIMRGCGEFAKVESVFFKIHMRRQIPEPAMYLRAKNKPVAPWWRLRNSFDDAHGDVFLPVTLTMIMLGNYKYTAAQIADALGLEYSHRDN